jgi:hypothetical protein
MRRWGYWMTASPQQESKSRPRIRIGKNSSQSGVSSNGQSPLAAWHSGVTALLVNAVILSLAYAGGLWLGGNANNLWILLRLTVPLAVLLGLVAAIWPEPKVMRIRTSPFVLAIIGAAIGCAYWYRVGRITGLGFLALAIQALVCWTATAATTLPLTIGPRSRAVLIGVVIVCLLAVVVPSPTFNYFSHNQRLTVAFAVPEELGSPVESMPIGFNSQAEVEKTTSHVLRSIRMSGILGNYRIVHLSRQGEGKDSLAIVVMNAPVNDRIPLPEPNATELIYAQQPQGWAKSPAQGGTLNRSIEISPGHRTGTLAYFGIPNASGLSLMGRIPVGGTDR